jgi:hypothetical protein
MKGCEMENRHTHFELADQHERDQATRDNVRSILGPLTEADLDAQQAYKRAPFPTTRHNHAHRHSAGTLVYLKRQSCSACDGGLTHCSTPEACERATDPPDGISEEADPPRPPMRPGDFWALIACALAGWALLVGAYMALPWGEVRSLVLALLDFGSQL